MKIKRLSRFKLNINNQSLIVSVCEFNNKIIYLASDGQTSLVHTLAPLDNGLLQVNVLPCVWSDQAGFINSHMKTASVEVLTGKTGFKLYTIKRSFWDRL